MTSRPLAAPEARLLVEAIEDLLCELAKNGIRVGVTERSRLEVVLRLEGGAASLDDLEHTVAAVVVKSREDARTFGEVAARWRRRMQMESELPPPPRLPPVPVARVPPWRRALAWVRGRPRSVAAGAGLAVVLGLLAWVVLREDPSVRPIVPPPPPPPRAEAEARDIERICVPIPTQVEPSPWYTRIPPAPAALAAFFLLAFAATRWAARRVPLRRPPPPRGEPRGWGVLSVDPSPGDERVALDGRSEDALVWGMGHYLSDAPTHRVDVARTVRATAAGAGLPRLVYHRAREHRGVWLWRDTADPAPELATLVSEVVQVLEAAGLPAEQSTFYRLPDELQDAHGARVGLAEVDERQRQCRVVLFTTGEAWAREARTVAGRARLDQVWDLLAGWPELAVALCGEPNPELARLVASHGIWVLEPAHVVPFLAGLRLAAPAAAGDPSPHDDRLWSFACALSPWPVSPRQALRLHSVLGLGGLHGHLAAWRREGTGSGARVTWPLTRRLALAHWAEAALGYAEPGAEGGVVDQAAAFWREEAAAMRERLAELPGWRGSDSESLHAINEAMVGLWTRAPSDPIAQLHALHRAGWAEAVESALSALAPADAPDRGPRRARLPWRADSLGPEAQLRLRELGFHVDAEAAVAVRLPARRRLGLALQAGAAAGAAVAALAATLQPPPAPRSLALAAGAEAPDQCLSFVRVPPGVYELGSTAGESDERPVWKARFSDGYWIGEFEVTHAQYKRFDPSHEYDPSEADHPVVKVDWYQASAFCRALDLGAQADPAFRLPTEAEWEAAARGTDGRTYPWGNEPPEQKRVVWRSSETAAVGSATDDIGPFGTRHQGGNAIEWVWDCYDAQAYASRAAAGRVDNPVDSATDCGLRVLRGGAFRDVDPGFLRAALRRRLEPGLRSRNFGFRCARGPGRQP